MINIRPLSVQDAPFLCGWSPYSAWESLSPDDQARTHPLRVQRYAHGLLGKMASAPQSAFILIADLAGHPVGYGLGSLGREGTTGEWEGHAMDLFVLPPLRRRGIGRRLQQEMERVFARAGVRKVKIVGGLHNIPAMAMATTSGFKPEGLIHYREW